MTDSNLTRFALVKEATRNTTPANPIFQIMWATGITLTDNNQTVVSDEIRSDRMTSPEILVGRAGGESFNFEFSNSHFDDLLVAALLGTRTRIAFKYNNGVADSEITAVTDSSDTYTVNRGGASFKAGHLAKAEGFTNAANNRIFKVASSTGTTVVAAGTPTLTDETAPPGTAKLQVTGFEGASGALPRPLQDSAPPPWTSPRLASPWASSSRSGMPATRPTASSRRRITLMPALRRLPRPH